MIYRLLHSVLYDYIRECGAEDKAELITTLSPLIVPLSNSLPGVNTASICIWQGTNKDKKVQSRNSRIYNIIYNTPTPLATLAFKPNCSRVSGSRQ